MISGTLRHEGAVVAEDQEPLARAFGQVEHQVIVPPGIRMGDCRPGEPPVCGRLRRGRPRGPQNFARRPRGTGRRAHRPPRPFGVSDLAALLATPPAATVPGAAASPTMWPPSGADRCGDHA